MNELRGNFHMGGDGNFVRKFDKMGMKMSNVGNRNGNGNCCTGMGQNGNRKQYSFVQTCTVKHRMHVALRPSGHHQVLCMLARAAVSALELSLVE